MSTTIGEPGGLSPRTGKDIPAERMDEIRRSWSDDDPAAAAAQFVRLEDAAAEPSVSGQLRRAVHASGRPLSQIAKAVGVEPRHLGEWLEGQRTLRSDILDRIGLAIQATVTSRSRLATRAHGRRVMPQKRNGSSGLAEQLRTAITLESSIISMHRQRLSRTA